jgi:hypothetical protein
MFAISAAKPTTLHLHFKPNFGAETKKVKIINHR